MNNASVLSNVSLLERKNSQNYNDNAKSAHRRYQGEKMAWRRYQGENLAGRRYQGENLAGRRYQGDFFFQVILDDLWPSQKFLITLLSYHEPLDIDSIRDDL